MSVKTNLYTNETQIRGSAPPGIGVDCPAADEVAMTVKEMGVPRPKPNALGPITASWLGEFAMPVINN
jgi:hypothetical protein